MAFDLALTRFFGARSQPARAALLTACALVAATAHAHQLNVSYLEVRERETSAEIFVELDPHDTPLAQHVDRDGDGVFDEDEVRAQRQALAAFVFGRLSMRLGQRACLWNRAFDDGYDHAASLWRAHATLQCPMRPAEAFIVLEYLEAMPAGHQVFATVGPAGGPAGGIAGDTAGGAAQRFVLKRRASVIAPRAAGLARAFFDFAGAGFRHISQGLDHLAFVLALILGARAWRAAVYALSAFTLAHSLTLALAALDLVRLPGRPVEVAIALSIALMAGENLAGGRWAGLSRWRPGLAFAFGLVHGLGFATALEGAPGARGGFIVALAGFNVGIEACQLVLVGAALPAILAWQQSARVTPWQAGLLALPAMVLWLAAAPLNAVIAGLLPFATWALAARLRRQGGDPAVPARRLTRSFDAALVVSGLGAAILRLLTL